MQIPLKSYHILGFDDKLFFWIGIPIIALMVNGILFGHIVHETPYLFLTICYPIGIIYTTVYWLSFRTMYLLFVRQYPAHVDARKRYSVLIPRVLLLFAAVLLLLTGVDRLFIDEIDEPVADPSFLTMMIASLVLVVLVISLYEGAYLFVQLKKSRLEQEQLITQNISSQLEGLKSQVNPHFLFNSLNTLAAMIPEDSDRSVRFVTQLSKVYRYILDIKDQQLVTVGEELDFIKAYIYLIEQRFADNLSIDVTVHEKHLDRLIIPMSMQIVFENAIKHNIITKKQPLTITVTADRDSLSVGNTLQKKRGVSGGTGQGLANIKNRYAFFTDRAVEVTEDNASFIVKLPTLPTVS
jgi:sensor histidine kinase YesM